LAGTNKVLKQGQVLFKAGDKSDGMYLIRRGELSVYLEQDGKEVVLAKIGEGGMIGEMSLFDKEPRSASVKALAECEVTLISTDDFGKLMKQIPKWFVGLMTALSGRLRQTNDRLRKIEAGAGQGAAGAKGKPFQAVLRTLHVLILLWHKDGEKDGKDWVLPKQQTEQVLVEQFGEDKDKLKGLFDVLVHEKLLATRQDSTRKVVLALNNRAALSSLAAFMQTFLKANPTLPCLPDAPRAMLRVLDRLVTSAPYDTSTISLADLIKEAKRDGVATSTWEKDIHLLAKGGEEVKVVKTSGGPGLRAAKKDVTQFVRSHEVLASLYKANLS
jgi:hypothetical protein